MRLDTQLENRDEERMSQLSDLATMSTEHQWSELARLFAYAVVRVLLKRASSEREDSPATQPETPVDGLEDS